MFSRLTTVILLTLSPLAVTTPTVTATTIAAGHHSDQHEQLRPWPYPVLCEFPERMLIGSPAQTSLTYRVIQSSSGAVTYLLESLGVVLSEVNVPVGLDCSPISVAVPSLYATALNQPVAQTTS
ncbi:hypothetical protein BDW22DRAFT_1354645 [Trametopsis cervina]|nr:hypothetical protein BDW22DRAFT_1354645 [Trametopsis cervina]